MCVYGGEESPCCFVLILRGVHWLSLLGLISNRAYANLIIISTRSDMTQSFCREAFHWNLHTGQAVPTKRPSFHLRTSPASTPLTRHYLWRFPLFLRLISCASFSNACRHLSDCTFSYVFRYLNLKPRPTHFEKSLKPDWFTACKQTIVHTRRCARRETLVHIDNFQAHRRVIFINISVLNVTGARRE